MLNSKSAITILAGASLAVGCAPREGVSSATPFDAALAAGATAHEVAKHKGEDVVYGTRLEIVGDRARFFRCDSEESCKGPLVDMPARDILAVSVVGRTRNRRDDGPVGDEIDLLRMTIVNRLSTSRGGMAVDSSRGITMGLPTK